jgi:hypothetical protein
MRWLLALLLSLAAGWFLARALTARTRLGAGSPRWCSLVLEISLGALFGPGLASVLYFGLVIAGAASGATVFAALAALLLGSAAVWWFATPSASPLPTEALPRRKFPWTWALWICVAAGFAFFLLDFQTTSSAEPTGDWDAMAIWNARARFLAGGGDLWRRAVSSDMGGGMVGSSHPGYPLFLSGVVAMQWTAAGRFGNSVPIGTSLLISVAAFALLGAGVACRKSVTLGLLAWLVLLASEVFASQTAAQYSDLLQALAFLATLILLDAAWPEEAKAASSARLLIAAGLAVGLAAWVKNEGLPFAIAAFAVVVWRFRIRGTLWTALGAAPGLLAVVALKLISQGREAVFPRTVGEAVDKIATAGRWWQAALGFGKAVFEAGQIWTHPVLLAALLALALRFVPAAERRARVWLWIPIGVTAAAEYGIYLLTTANLDWHISTSVSRLVAQLWPSLIWLFFLMLRAPEEYFAVPSLAGAGTAEAKLRPSLSKQTRVRKTRPKRAEPK